MWVTWHGSWLSCLFVAGFSGDGFGSPILRDVFQGCMYHIDDFACLLTQKVHTLHLPDLLQKVPRAAFRLLTSFFPSCELHVLPVVLTSCQPTPHT